MNDKKIVMEIPDQDFELIQFDNDIKDKEFETAPIGFFKDALIRFRKNKASFIAFVIICIIALMAVLGPFLNQHGFNQQYLDYQNMPPKIELLDKLGIRTGTRMLTNRRAENLSNTEKYPEGSIIETFNPREIRGIEVVDVKVDYYKYSGADQAFWFGTDYLGRDLWTRLWRGSRVSLFIALVSAFTNLIIGVIFGAIAGYYGGKADMIMMRICEIIQAFPRIVIVTLFIMFFGTGLFSIIMALVIRGWIGTARLIRAQFYRFKNREYILASRTLGVSDLVIIFRHILPNSIGPVITRTMIAVPSAIFAEAFLAFIGLGLQAPEPTIGVLLSNGQSVLLNYPYQTFFPAIVISALMISFNLFANGLRDAFDPTLRGV